MSKPLRSLSGLIDFDCAARWGSFKLAAQELHKTPAAISLQVKQLEEAVGFELFTRHPRHIALTDKGRELAATVHHMLADLRAKVEALQGGDDENILHITTTHSLAIKWLVPRIGRFTKLYPEIDIRIASNDRTVNLEEENIDVALRMSRLVSGDPHLLYPEQLVVIYSPTLLPPGQDELTLADLQRFPLLSDESTDDWIHLLRENQLLKGKYDFAATYTNFAVMVQSVLAGQGVGMTSYAIAYEDLRSGALKMMACRSAPYDYGVRLVANRNKEGMSKITRFRAWIKDEVREMQEWLT
jgi:LysR family glycine cleavage system transcriptional activator